MSADGVNAFFEGFAAMTLLINVVRLAKDRELRGVSWVPTAFFTAWGFWNVYYYPSLGQTMSFYAGLAVVVVNCSWLAMVGALWWIKRSS